MKNKEVYTKEQVVKMFMDFYNKVKHGDDEHKKWLLDETKDYLKARLDDHMTSKVVFIDLSREAKIIDKKVYGRK